MPSGYFEYLAGVFGTPETALVNTVLREKYVYKRILENVDDFSPAELAHANK